MENIKYIYIKYNISFGTIHLRRQHFLVGGGRVKSLPNLPTNSSKKTADGRGGRGQKLCKLANVLNGWSISLFPFLGYVLFFSKMVAFHFFHKNSDQKSFAFWFQFCLYLYSTQNRIFNHCEPEFRAKLY